MALGWAKLADTGMTSDVPEAPYAGMAFAFTKDRSGPKFTDSGMTFAEAEAADGRLTSELVD